MRPPSALLILAAAWVPPAALAQPASDPRPTAITLRPATAPVPALKYRLVPEHSTLVPGNAAVFYHRGILMLVQNRPKLVGKGHDAPGANPDMVDELTVANWTNGPIGEIPRDKARKHLEAYRNVLKEVELGARRSTCDWDFDRRNEGIFLQLPEIQEIRSVARLVALRARLAILDGKTDLAMRWIETGLVLGRHVSQGPIIIQALVGISIELVMTRCLEDLIQAPGGPNLYWALADRPRPFIDMRPAIEGERYSLEKELPELSELDRRPWSLEEARRFTDTLERKLYSFNSGKPLPDADAALPMDLSDMSRRLGIAAMAAKIYPEAKRALIARGRAETQVEAMPVIQVAALHCMDEYRRIRDDTYKWMNVPYWQSFNRIDRPISHSMNQKLSNPLLTQFLNLMPALDAVRRPGTRLDRQLDAMQCIEAIRLYAHAHEGKLPTSLEAITDLPLPLDPATGKPFLYQVNGDSATFSAPPPPGFNFPAAAIHYELKLAR
ncbi:MAG: hypothetical protein ACLQVF_04430 [Isosphaeraceae bacterium]